MKTRLHLAFHRPLRVLALLTLLLPAAAWPAAAQHMHGHGHGDGGPGMTAPSPYAGQESRAVKALSPETTAGLKKGEGLGMAKAAELNGYPGPRHVLDMAAGLELTAEQREATQTVFDHMQASAQALGRSILEAERTLDTAFAQGSIDPDRLQRLTGEIGRLQGQLRNVHLRAHLEMKHILTAQQVAAYDRLRGYTAR